MMELKISKTPLTRNPNCASCGRVFNEKGLTLELEFDHQKIRFPLCQSCFDAVPLFEAEVRPEQGTVRLKR
jgi:hypothetical protein